jgi:hypothetical protein
MTKNDINDSLNRLSNDGVFDTLKQREKLLERIADHINSVDLKNKVIILKSLHFSNDRILDYTSEIKNSYE